MHVIVSGCGRVGSQLSEFLSYEGHDVMVIDKDPEAFKRLGAAFNGVTIEGVAFDEEVLAEAQAEKADAFAAVTNFDNTNLMTAELATSIYQIPKVVSRLYYPERELTFFKMGIEYVCSTTLLADRFKELLVKGEDAFVQQDRLDLGLQLVEFRVTGVGAGRPAGELNAGVSSHVVSLVRDGKELDWDESTLLSVGDHVLVTLRREGWRAIAACLGESMLDDPACRLAVVTASPETEALLTGEGQPVNVVIGGCSAVGAHLGYLLALEGNNVTIIDEDPALFDRLPEGFDGRFIEGVIYDEEALLEADIENAQYFAAVTKLDNKNLMAAEVARHVFEVPRVVSRLFNPDKEQTYQALGISYVCGTRMIAEEILGRILQPVMRRVGTCFNNLFDVVEFDCPPSWDSKTAAEVKAGARIAFVARRSSGHMPEERFVLHSGDKITMIGSHKSLDKLERYLKKHRKG